MAEREMFQRSRSADAAGGVFFDAAEATWTFLLRSHPATRVTLLLFSPDDWQTPSSSHDLARDPHYPRSRGDLWRVSLPHADVSAAAWYAYRVDGPRAKLAPNGDEIGPHAFDPDKVLFDPYAHELFIPPTYSREHARRPGNNAGKAVLGVLPRVQIGPRVKTTITAITGTDAAAASGTRLHGDLLASGRDLIIYEMHVRGFTRSQTSGVDAPGTFAGVIEKLPYLRDLGITAIELMPVFQFDPQENNYWGYMPMSFFAVHQGYASAGLSPDGPRRAATEFRALVDAAHAAGLEVILDSVMNHTSEATRSLNAAGKPDPTLSYPTQSLRGIDNAGYFHTKLRLAPQPAGPTGQSISQPNSQTSSSTTTAASAPADIEFPVVGPAAAVAAVSAGPYVDYSGCGHALDVEREPARELVLTALRWWVREFGIDGFRHDLAAIALRRADGTIDPDPALFRAIAEDPVLASVRHIAEPWDAAGAYLLGPGFPARRALQWNDKFRDCIRRFIRGDGGLLPQIMQRLYGSDDAFGAIGPRRSLNYFCSHDGYSLYDMLSYTARRNQANGHHNTDGPTFDISSNCGHEGDDGVPDAVLAERERRARNAFCLLLLANGTPMFRMGDEFLQTQGGNNNPYNQDNATSWLDWSRRRTFAAFHAFVKGMLAFRHAHPSIWGHGWWGDRMTWFGPADANMDWGPEGRELAYILRGEGSDSDLYVMINMSDRDRLFRLLAGGDPSAWRCVIDTSRQAWIDRPEPSAGTELRIPRMSISVLEREAAAAGPR